MKSIHIIHTRYILVCRFCEPECTSSDFLRFCVRCSSVRSLICIFQLSPPVVVHFFICAITVIISLSLSLPLSLSLSLSLACPFLPSSSLLPDANLDAWNDSTSEERKKKWHWDDGRGKLSFLPSLQTLKSNKKSDFVINIHQFRNDSEVSGRYYL